MFSKWTHLEKASFGLMVSLGLITVVTAPTLGKWLGFVIACDQILFILCFIPIRSKLVCLDEVKSYWEGLKGQPVEFMLKDARYKHGMLRTKYGILLDNGPLGPAQKVRFLVEDTRELLSAQESELLVQLLLSIVGVFIIMFLNSTLLVPVDPKVNSTIDWEALPAVVFSLTTFFLFLLWQLRPLYILRERNSGFMSKYDQKNIHVDETEFNTELTRVGYEPGKELPPEAREIFATLTRNIFHNIARDQEEYPWFWEGLQIVVCPTVFSPLYFGDSSWFAKTLRHIVKVDSSFLDMGTGTGIIPLVLSRNGVANVFGTDIHPTAVENARLNFCKNDVDPARVYGPADLFGAIPEGKKFDFIFWNHPFMSTDNPNELYLYRAGFDYEYNAITRYIQEGASYLTECGRLLLGTGTFAECSRIEQVATNAGYSIKVLQSEIVTLQPKGSVKTEFRIVEFVRKEKLILGICDGPGVADSRGGEIISP